MTSHAKQKPHTVLSDELRVLLVAEARFTPSSRLPALLARYGVSSRTLERSKHLVASSPALSAMRDEQMAKIRERWKDAGTAAMRETLGALQEQAAKARALPEFSAQAMRTCAGAAKILGELLLTDDMVHPVPIQSSKSLTSRAAGESSSAAITAPPVH